MPNQVIKITKRRIRFRRFVDKVQALTTAAAKWISKQWRRTSLSNQTSERVIRIGNVATKDTGADYIDKLMHPITSLKESAGVSDSVNADSLHTDIQKGGIWLTAPPDRATVPYRPFIEGRITDPRARVWVVIHPMEVSDYWVQPAVSLRGDGSWRVQVFIGRPGMIDLGKSFELMAFGNPNHHMEEALVLSWWPEAEWQSQVIELIRG